MSKNDRERRTQTQGLYILSDSLLVANWVSTSGREPKPGKACSFLSQLRPPTSQLGPREPWPPWKPLFSWDKDCTVKPYPHCPGKAWPLGCLQHAAVDGAFQNARGPLGPLSPRRHLGFWHHLCFWDGSHCVAVFCVHAGCCSLAQGRLRCHRPGTWRDHLAYCDTAG